jgi:uridine phosphorylase
MQNSQYPILQFDPDRTAMINPAIVKARQNGNTPFPKRCLLTFFTEVFNKYKVLEDSVFLTSLFWESDPIEIYECTLAGERTALVRIGGVGAPLACGILEDVIALGATHIMACGGAGVLDSAMDVGHIMVPTAAVRDEGLSYHYLPPSPEVEANPEVIQTIENTLIANQLPYQKIKTWTTDAFYRETKSRVALRKEQGCTAVEMECASFMAVAQFRGVKFGQLLYAGDNLDAPEWDERSWSHASSVREQLVLITAECLKAL